MLFAVLSSVRASLIAVVVLLVAATPAHALVSWGNGTNEIFVTGALSAGYDSNLSASANGQGENYASLVLGSEYTRNAGLIGLKASVTVNATRYHSDTAEDFNNPAFRADFTKTTGRTTGTLSLHAIRENRADAAVNVRTESWNYGADLNLRYPVIKRYAILGNLGYLRRDFSDNTLLSDLDSYTAGADLAYNLRTGRDLLAGYHFQQDDTSAHFKNTNHAFTVGLTGQLLPRVTGVLNAGYTIRVPDQSTDSHYSSWTGNSSLNWKYDQRFNLTASLSKNFSTTANNLSTDTVTSALRGEYAMNAKISFNDGTSWSHSKFLEQGGLGRRDDMWSWDAAVVYTLNPHFNFSLSYQHQQNWSTLAFADFTRHNVSLTLSARF